MNFWEISKNTHFLTEHLLWLLLKRKTILFPWPGWYVNSGGFFGVVLVHETRSNDARFMHKLCFFYIEINRDIKEVKI